MKSLKKIRLTDVAPAEIDASAMSVLYAGVDDGISLLAYGCKQNVCTKKSQEGMKSCTTDTCETYTCVTLNQP